MEPNQTYRSIDEIRAEHLLRLARDHRAKCDRRTCSISLSLFIDTYRGWMRRPLTPEEREIFI